METSSLRDLCAGSIRAGVTALHRVRECAELDVRDDLRAERIQDMPGAIAVAELAVAEASRYAGLIGDAEVGWLVDRFARRVADIRHHHDADGDRLRGCGPTIFYYSIDAARYGLDAAEVCECGRANPGRWGWLGAYPMPE